MNIEKSIEAYEKRQVEMFGDVNSYNLSALPLETLTAMSTHFAGLLYHLHEKEAVDKNNWHSSKVAVEIEINKKKIEHLKGLAGSDKARIATMYAEADYEVELRGVAALLEDYELSKSKVKSVDTLHRTLTQVISTVKKEKETQQFIDGK